LQNRGETIYGSAFGLKERQRAADYRSVALKLEKTEKHSNCKQTKNPYNFSVRIVNNLRALYIECPNSRIDRIPAALAALSIIA
jgi:hypothetical protein